MDTTTNTSTSDILRTAKWYESGLMLYWGDIKRTNALVLDLIHASTSSDMSDEDISLVVARARQLLQEMGHK